MNHGAMPGAERGSGLLSTVFGVAVLLGLLAVAAHVAIGLWARTTTESIAYDAAVHVATAGPGVDAQTSAITDANRRLGRRAAEVELTFVDAPGEFVVLHVKSEPVGLLPVITGRTAIVGGLDKTIRIRREQESST